MTERVAETGRTMLAGRLEVPAGTRALLFDMDGVLIDSLTQDYQIAADLLSPYAGRRVEVPRELVRRWFALALDDFWAKIVAELGLALGPTELAEIAWTIDSPELHEIAVRLQTGLDGQGREFHDLSADELTNLSSPFEN